MNYASGKVEFSPNPLSNTTPTWVDITSHVRHADWSSGKAKDLDDPQAGGATFVLRNDGRMFEPEYAASPFYPNIVPLRRFRLSVVTSTGTTQQGIYYATDWGLAYPGGSGYSEVSVTCVDGFGLLSLFMLGALDPPDASTLADVMAFDEPFVQFTLDDLNSTKMAAATGTDGVYKNGVLLGVPGIAVGDLGTAVTFGPNLLSCGRSPLADSTQFSDGDAFTMECVFDNSTATRTSLMFGPWNLTLLDHVFAMLTTGGGIYTNISGVITSNIVGFGSMSSAVHHVALVWDGNSFIAYVDGVETNRNSCGGNLVAGAATEFLYVGGSVHVNASGTNTIQHAAFYEQALPASRILAHANAALHRGYATQTAGSRIAALATNALWSTAAITASLFNVAPRMQTGQATLDEIITTVQAETPWGLFYFNDAGNPAYRGWSSTTGVTQAIFGDAAGEVPYTDIGLAYDDELYNQVTVARDGGVAQTQTDATSIGQYLARSPETLTGLILANDTDANTVSSEILASFKDPKRRVATLSLNGANPAARAQILTREIGDLIRIKRRPTPNATPIDVITTILGKQKAIDPNGNLSCTWNLARGVNASVQTWRLGLAGYTELDTTTILA